MSELPPLIEPQQLEPLLGRDNLLVVDLSKGTTHQQLHIPGAVFLEYERIIVNRKPAYGLVPPLETLEQVLSESGIGNRTHVVAYDDEGGGKACRLLWTLDTLGHTSHSLLNGGLHAWANERFPMEQKLNPPTPARFSGQTDTTRIADARYILEHLDNPRVCLLDARSPQEYSGAKRFAERAGHIPGAVNMEWLWAMDRERNLRLRPEAQLRNELEALGITPDREVITYCQTHHRSSFTYFLLKLLGYPQVRGYPGSWSDWGNRSDTPVAC